MSKFLLLLLLILSACTSETSPDYYVLSGVRVTDKHIEIATQVCQSNGGYKSVDTSANLYYPNTKTHVLMVYARCKNGAEFKKYVKYIGEPI